MTYVPNADDATNPLDVGIPATTAPAEFRAIKTKLNGVTNPAGMNNTIHNGDFRVDRRNFGNSVSPLGTSKAIVDRWVYLASVTGKFNGGQNLGAVTPEVGRSNYLGLTSTSAYSVASTDYFVLSQTIEAIDLAKFDYGAAGALATTLIFSVYSSKTGVFGGAVTNGSTTVPRAYPFTYTITSANTWTRFAIAIPGDTSGTWSKSLGAVGAVIYFDLGSGSTYLGTASAWSGAAHVGITGGTSVVATNAATFYISGVEWKLGSFSSTSIAENRLYAVELSLCGRFYETIYDTGGLTFTAGSGAVELYTTVNSVSVKYKYLKWLLPTITTYDNTGAAGNLTYFNGSWNAGGAAVFQTPSNLSGFSVALAATYADLNFGWIADAENYTLIA